MMVATSEEIARLRDDMARFREENARFMGRIETKVESLAETVAQRESFAANYRRETREKLATLAKEVATVGTTVSEMKPAVESFNNLRLKASGAVIVLGIIGAALGAIAGYFADTIKAFLLRFVH